MNWVCLQEEQMQVCSCQSLWQQTFPTLCYLNPQAKNVLLNNSNIHSREEMVKLPSPRQDPRPTLENLVTESRSFPERENLELFCWTLFPWRLRVSDYGRQSQGNVTLNTYHPPMPFILSAIPFPLVCLISFYWSFKTQFENKSVYVCYVHTFSFLERYTRNQKCGSGNFLFSFKKILYYLNFQF